MSANEGRRQGGRSGEAAPPQRAATATPPLALQQPAPAFYSPHHGSYQPWMPPQFSPMAAYGGPAFYMPPPSPLPYAAPPSPGPPGAEQPRFVPLAGMVMGLPSEATAPRGWGGMQFEQQAAHGQPGDYSRGERPRPPPPPARRSGRNSGGHEGSSERRGRALQRADLSTQLQLEELLLHLKRLPRDTPLHPSVLQSLRQLDGRGLAQLVRELGRSNMAQRGAQLFDLVRSLGPAHELARLLDEYAYTSMVANCGQRQALDQALVLVQEMQERGIPCNVHTYSALMNVAIKCGQYRLALDVYRDMRAAGCPANVVTFNTLCDVYGKSGQWEEALAVLEVMRAERVQPVTRTYNTVMIACNTSGQWQEALRVYDRMLTAGQQPNTTTYNALISAHSKAGDLPKVLETFEEMVSKGCERSVITYSSLISACEKAGEWKLALQLFDEMRAEGCTPNVISYNSLIAACAQGAQWEKAGEVFDAMQSQGCRPDVVTYTALIQAYERGGKWRRALASFEDMQARQCTPDSIILNIILDVLWETGVAWAQRRAAGIFREATEEGLIRRHSHASAESLELNLHSTTVAVALLSLHTWLAELCGRGADLPARISIIAGKGKAKDAGHSIIKETVTALLRSLHAPFQESADATAYIGRLEASGETVAQWLAAQGPAVLSCIIPPLPDAVTEASGGSGAAAAPASAAVPSSGPDEAGGGGEAAAAVAAAAAAVAGLHIGSGGSRWRAAGQRADRDLQEELAAEARAAEAFSMAQYFEKTHNLNVQLMSTGYLSYRPELARLAATLGATLRLPEEAVHDAMLLLDRAMSVPLEAPENLHRAALAACLLLAARQAGLPERRVPEPGAVAEAAGVAPVLLGQVQAALLAALQNDTASISALRCLTLYLERLGGEGAAAAAAGGSALAGSPLGRDVLALLREVLGDEEFLNYRPSVTAAAVLLVARKSRGLAPYWPTALSSLTGYSGGTAELAAAIAGAQRLQDKVKQEAAASSAAASSATAAASSAADAAATSASAAAPPPGLQRSGRSASGASDASSAGPLTPQGATSPLQSDLEAGQLNSSAASSSANAAAEAPPLAASLPQPAAAARGPPAGSAQVQQPEPSA